MGLSRTIVSRILRKVLSSCVINLFTLLILDAPNRLGWSRWDFGVDGRAHAIATVAVSVLVALNACILSLRHSQFEKELGIMIHESRGIIQDLLVFSRKEKNTNVGSKEWRLEVIYRVLMTVKTSFVALNCNILPHHHCMLAWEVPELTGPELEFCRPKPSWRKYAQVPYNEANENGRVARFMAVLLKESIANQNERLLHPLTPLLESKLLDGVSRYSKSFNRVEDLVQLEDHYLMNATIRAILTVYLLSIPFIFTATVSKDSLVLRCIQVCVLTSLFSTAGSLKLDFPNRSGYGNDDTGIGFRPLLLFEEALVLVHNSDGVTWADALRYKMHQKAEEPLTVDELTSLLGTIQRD